MDAAQQRNAELLGIGRKIGEAIQDAEERGFRTGLKAAASYVEPLQEEVAYKEVANRILKLRLQEGIR